MNANTMNTIFDDCKYECTFPIIKSVNICTRPVANLLTQLMKPNFAWLISSLASKRRRDELYEHMNE